MNLDELLGSRIVVVEDDPSSMLLLERMLALDGYTNVVAFTDPAEALRACLRQPPDIMLLDLRMPGFDGFEMLARLHSDADEDWLPVIVLTAERGGEAKRRALTAGAHDYITKPFDREEAMLRIRNLLHTSFLHRRLASANRALETIVEERTSELGEARHEVLERLAMAGEFRDDVTGQHAARVGLRSAQLARTLSQPAREVELIKHAAKLHDIGKIAVRDAVLLKPGKLSDAEYTEMKLHTTVGADLLAASESPLLQLAEEIARSHHERWDGGGYPEGLAGEEIPLSGRIVAVADVFDALTQDRPYRDAWSLDDAIEEIESQSGRHFDPTVVNAFTATIGPLVRSKREAGSDDIESAPDPDPLASAAA